ncbi:MAG: hypothetical protein NVS1B4_15260 [Gemmatimonadaceae bacterium]
MRIEIIPVILGMIVFLVGAGIIWDAWKPETMLLSRERRRRQRAERSRPGQALLGGGTVAMGSALIGLDTWRFAVLAVILGAIALVAGAVMNYRFLGEVVSNRGPLRRDPTTQIKPGMPEQTPQERSRIR